MSYGMMFEILGYCAVAGGGLAGLSGLATWGTVEALYRLGRAVQ